MVASTNLTSLAFDAETVFGTTNATPQFTVLPTTGGSPTNSISTSVSEVIRADRQVDDLVVTDGDIAGELNYELSYAPYADFMGSVLMNNTTRSMNETGISVTAAAADTITKAALDTIIEPGDVIRLSSAADPTIDGEYTAISTASGSVTVYPSTGAGSDQIDLVAVATVIRENGNDAIDGYTIRKKAIDSDAADYYWYYNGCAVNTMSFNFATGSILNGTLGIVGLGETAQDTPLAGEQADIATPAYSIMNSVTSVGLIRISGVTLGTCQFASLELTIDNQIEAAKSIGTLGACSLTAHSLMVTGNTEVYFANLDLYNKFVAASSFSVTIIATDGDGNTIGIDMPYCKFESLETPVSGKDAFLMQSGSFRALRDSTRDYTIKISRIDA